MKTKIPKTSANEQGTYEIQTLEGKVLEETRTIATAYYFMKRLQKLYHQKLQVVKVKGVTPTFPVEVKNRKVYKL